MKDSSRQDHRVTLPTCNGCGLQEPWLFLSKGAQEDPGRGGV